MPYDIPFQHKPDSGSVFINDKGDNPKRPDFKGDGLFYGIPSWISLWKNKDKNGDTYCYISVTKKDEQSQPASGDGYKSGHNFDPDSDIPF